MRLIRPALALTLLAALAACGRGVPLIPII